MDLTKLSLEEIRAHKKDILGCLDELVDETKKYRQRLVDTLHLESRKALTILDLPSSLPTITPIQVGPKKGKLDLVRGPTKRKPVEDIEEFDSDTDIAIPIGRIGTLRGSMSSSYESVIDGPCPPTPTNKCDDSLPRAHVDRVKLVGNKYYVIDTEGHAFEYQPSSKCIKGKRIGIYNPKKKAIFSTLTDLVIDSIFNKDAKDESDAKTVKIGGVPDIGIALPVPPSPIPVIDSDEEVPKHKGGKQGGGKQLMKSRKNEKRCYSPTPPPSPVVYMHLDSESLSFGRQDHLEQVSDWVMNSNIIWYSKNGLSTYIILAPSGSVFKWLESTPLARSEDPDMNFRGPKLGYWDPIKKEIIPKPYEEIV
jgi:hypothetical protein